MEVDIWSHQYVGGIGIPGGRIRRSKETKDGAMDKVQHLRGKQKKGALQWN